MKRIIYLIFCCLTFISLQATNYTFNRTYTKGETYTIDPAADLDIPNTWGNYVSSINGGVGHYNEKYLVSDATAFTILPITHHLDYGGSSGTDYYSFQIVGQKVGVYTFYVQLYHNMGNTGASHSITYNITTVDVTSISMPSTLSMFIGNEQQITPIIMQAGATTTLTWQSSTPSVATISTDGTITANSQGTTIITCTAHNGVSAQCEVTVNPVMVSGITLNQTEAEMVVGEKLNLTTTVVPNNATDKGVTWSSTNETVAVVDESGQVTAVGSGTSQIKATANDGSGKTASCLVTVEKNNKLTVTDMTQCSGGRGVLNVLLSDEETIMGFQFDLQLPAGVTVAEDNNNRLMAALTGNAVNTHSISSSKVSDGLYRFVVTPQGSRAISNANGDGMTITIDVADEVATGTYQMTIKDIEMTVRKAGNVYEDIHPKNSTATLSVTEAVMGDVNGDGRVSVTDVISMNSYILEEEPAQFIRKVADLNGDGKVTITDMVQVIDIILGR